MKKLTWLLAFCAVLLFAQAGTAAAASPLRETVNDLIGTKYEWGGTSAKGFDCSGFVRYVYRQFGIDLPHSSSEQANYGKKVSRDDLQPGDLVFFHTYGKGITHVGIYVGNNNFAHAADNGVIFSDMDEDYYADHYVTARRILNTSAYEKIAAIPAASSDSNNS